MKAYKYVLPEDAHFLENNSLLIGSSRTYARIEDDRRDDLEGGVAIQTDEFMIDYDVATDAERALRSNLDRWLGPVGRPGLTQVFKRTQFIVQAPAHPMLCLCRTSDNPYWLAQGFTVVFEVIDVPLLAVWLRDAYPNVLGFPHAGYVRYVQRRFSLEEGLQGEPYFFAKDPKFEAEDEFRIVWVSRIPNFERMIANLTLSHGLIRRIQ